jgi:hypothetical protein
MPCSQVTQAGHLGYYLLGLLRSLGLLGVLGLLGSLGLLGLLRSLDLLGLLRLLGLYIIGNAVHPAKHHFFHRHHSTKNTTFFTGITPRKTPLFSQGPPHEKHHFFAAQNTTFSQGSPAQSTTILPRKELLCRRSQHHFCCRDHPRKLLPKHFKADDPTKRVEQSISDIFADFCGDLQLKQQLEVIKDKR